MARRRRFSSGKHAYLIDDRTGRKIRYKDAKTEWTGMRVHKSEWEPKHPQLTPPRVVSDAQVLRNPRPDQAEDRMGACNYFDDGTGFYTGTELDYTYWICD